jgi:hypothetical protein
MADEFSRSRVARTGDLAYLVEAAYHANLTFNEAMKRHPVTGGDEPETQIGRLEVERAEKNYKAARQAVMGYLRALGVPEEEAVASALSEDYQRRFAPPRED